MTYDFAVNKNIQLIFVYEITVMYSFEGDFRRKPQQNLAGASAQHKTDRDALILQLQQQRQKREVSIRVLFRLSYYFLYFKGFYGVSYNREIKFV